jgi:hypothetical protein
MANPPLPLDPLNPASPITYGTIVHYGLPDLEVTGILIDSYKRDQQYADTQEVQNQSGITVGIRMTDYRVNVSVDGRVIENASGGIDYDVKVGDVLEINGDKIVINSCSYSGAAKGFHSLSISGTSYSGIAALAPKGITIPSTT